MDIINTLQRLIMPNPRFGVSDSMYIKGESFIFRNGEIFVFPYGRISLDTYYNGFSTVVWKKACGISNICFKASGSGEAQFRVILVNEELVKYELVSIIKTLTCEIDTILELELNGVDQHGLIYIEMLALDKPFTLSAGEWFTKQPPLRNVKLGISITHFNRKEYIVSSMTRIREEILEDNKYSGCIELIVVDNSQNITANEANGIKVIPNKNTGGAGGFMRGLLHYLDDNNCTHVLFMDDDASCEMDSIKKTHTILSYVIEDNTAISGALFMKRYPECLVEKGAYFDNICHPLFHGWHMNSTENIVKSETFIQLPNYGAWWFFAFPIKHVKHMAFPFFVRGDDILFSMMNNFNIITTNGIASYAQEDFETKASPLTLYLDVRNHLVNMFFYKKPVLEVIKTYTRFYLMCLLSHQYGSVKAINLALKHVLGDISFWENNIDLNLVRTQINEFAIAEKMCSIELPKHSIDFKDNHESPIRRFFRRLTLNGVLLPLKNRIIYQDKSSKASFRQIFRYKKIFYYNRQTNKGYIAIVSRVSFILALIRLTYDCAIICIETHRQYKKYAKSVNQLTSKEFWKKELMQGKDPNNT